MSLKRPEPMEITPSVTLEFHLEDPQSLTGKSDQVVTIPARRGDSILGAALDAHIDIEHACGGVCACSTCHVYVVEGGDLLTEAEDEELDRVEEAPDVRRNSRLSCQCRIIKSGKIVVAVPAWNRNAVKETPHD